MQIGLPFQTLPPADVPPALPEFYFVRHRRARRYLLRVDVDGRVRVTIPRGGSRRQADAFARRNLDWIQRERSRVRAPACDPETALALRARAVDELPPLLMRMASALGLRVSGVSIRNQRARWGSCSRGGKITLNWRLLLMPDWVRDYVILHELMHLIQMDHSPAFWKLVEGVCPTYRDATRWLKAHGPSLQ
jgi:predicted metal-dependent hydrolase